LLAASPAHAQVMEPEPYPLGFGIAAGATIPVGDLGDAQSTGWHVEGLVDWTSPSTPLGFRADITYNNLGGKTINLPGQPTFETDSRNLFELTGDAVWHFRPNTTTTPNPWTPYILGGIGIYHIEGETVTTGITQTQTSGDNSTDFGLNIGGGVIFRLSGFSTFAEGRFHTVFSNGGNANFFPFSFGVRFGGR
jgi:opacity protein-like surface antigen